MKKILVVALVIALSVIGANAAFAAIANSKHDMTSAATTGTWSGRHLSSCQYCHAPHNPESQVIAPLWNKVTTAASNFTGYTFYATTATGGGAVGNQSITCLSCHDGVTSVTAVKNGQQTLADGTQTGGNADVSDAGLITGTANIGRDLSNDHPIGVYFGSTGAYAGVLKPASISNNIGLVGAYRAYGATVDTAKVECSSCHDPHGLDYAQDNDNSPFLRGSIQTICSDCHTTK